MSNFQEDEDELLELQIKYINQEISETPYIDIEEEIENEEETIDDINKVFLDQTDYFASKDNYSEKGKLIKNNLDNNTKGSLNTE